AQELGVQVCELLWCGAAGSEIELRGVLGSSETVRQRSVPGYRPGAHAPGVFHHIFRRAAGNRQAYQPDAAALLNREVHGAAVRRPSWGTLAVVQDGADLLAITAVGIHDPHVTVFHGCFAVGQAAARSAKDDALSVRGPQRIVLVRFRGGKAANAVVRHLQSENVVIEKLILIWFAIRNQ